MDEKQVMDYIKRYQEKLGKFPEIKKIAAFFDKPKNMVKDILDSLEEKGIVKRNHAQRNLVSKNLFSIKISGYLILQLFCILAGIGAAIISIYYSWIWFKEVMPLWAAWIVAFVWVGFSITSFEVFILYSAKTKSIFKKVSSFSILLLWLFMAGFSMISSMAGQYNNFRDSLKVEIKEENKDLVKVKKLEILEKQIKSKESQILDWKKQITILQNEISNGLTNTVKEDGKIDWNKRALARTNKNQIHEIQNSINKIQKGISGLYKEQEELLDQNTIVETNRIDRGTFYEWAESVISIPAIFIQFFLSIFPAIFFDIVSPVAFYFVILIKGVRKK